MRQAQYQAGVAGRQFGAAGTGIKISSQLVTHRVLAGELGGKLKAEPFDRSGSRVKLGVEDIQEVAAIVVHQAHIGAVEKGITGRSRGYRTIRSVDAGRFRHADKIAGVAFFYTPCLSETIDKTFS